MSSRFDDWVRSTLNPDLDPAPRPGEVRRLVADLQPQARAPAPRHRHRQPGRRRGRAGAVRAAPDDRQRVPAGMS